MIRCLSQSGEVCAKLIDETDKLVVFYNLPLNLCAV